MSTTKNITLKLTILFDDHRPVYVSGNFCEWFPDQQNFQMKKVGTGQYQFEFPKGFDLGQNIEYKYTRGGWNQVELDYYGNPPSNRTISTTGEQQDFVPFWRINGKNYDESLMPKVEKIENFKIPQLNRERNIHVLLPVDYQASNKHYPVLYLLDAQNLFGEGSKYGNWRIDEKLSIMKSRKQGDVIVVAIEHGEEKRFDEFSPYKTTRGGGEGKKFANFIAKTLKPYIDEHYRTKPEPENSVIGGSSMGGLLSLYTGIMYAEHIGKMMVFSPSLWVSNKIYFDISEFFSPSASSIYLYVGGHESKTMLTDIKKLQTAIDKQKFPINKFKLQTVINQKGEHTENDWGKEFTEAVEWLTAP